MLSPALRDYLHTFITHISSILNMVAASKLSLVVGSVLAPAAVNAFTVQSFASSLDNSLMLSPYTAPLPYKQNSTLSSWGLTINDTPSGHKQVIDGFGAAVTDSTVSVGT
jgi:hypothetical protein